ncbi:MAG: MOSC N-terminal beta barrel domain-containing protein [Bacteroidota bacterium]
MIITAIHIYPIKSIGGISLSEAKAERRGLQYDRRWMLVDEAGVFVTQREIPAMALLRTALEAPFLTVYSSVDPTKRIQIPLAPKAADMEKLQVSVWSQKCSARVHTREINDWFSSVLGQNLRLVYMPDTTRRAADGRYAPKGHYVSFADGFPYLVIGQASLDDLNQRLETPVPMNRFRPNFVFKGEAPFAEDNWSDFSIGSVQFKGVKPCGRCIMTTIDQDTASKNAEPLKTMSGFRRSGQKVLFGQNVVLIDPETPAKTVRVGDEIRLLQTE